MNLRPNHYHHDSLGDPATCSGDHNHPKVEPEIRCTRCKTDIILPGNWQGARKVLVETISLDAKSWAKLCGPCGIDLEEFLVPDLLRSQEYLDRRDEVLRLWGVRR